MMPRSPLIALALTSVGAQQLRRLQDSSVPDGYVRASVTVTDPDNMATLDKVFVLQTDAPNSEGWNMGWSGTFDADKCGNGALPPADGVYYTQHNCRYSSYYHDSTNNLVPAGAYSVRLTATSAADGWSANGHDFYAQAGRADDTWTQVPGYHTDIAFTVTVGDPTAGFAGAALSVQIMTLRAVGESTMSAAGSTPVYSVPNEELDWEEVRAYCSARGGTLARVSSEAEQALVTSVTEPSGATNFWLGGNDKSEEGRWVWVGQAPASGQSFPPSTEPDLTYDNWSPTQPNDYGGGEDCMRFRRSAEGTSRGVVWVRNIFLRAICIDL